MWYNGSMTRNTYLIIGLVLLLIIAGFVYVKTRGGEVLAPTGEEVTTSEEAASQTPPPASPSPTSPSDEEPLTKTVTYTDTGFSPASLTVKTGDTVIFKNNSDSDFWPASAVHPTHEIYPEFDAKRAISAGGSYSFTFTRTGSWKYHNHLNPAAKGTITVQ